MRTQPFKIAILGVCLAAFATGCATYDAQGSDVDQHQRAKRGALIGAAIGVAAGLLSGDSAVERRQHAMVGAGIGALAGGAVGNYQDKQEAELRRETAGTGIDVSRDGDVIKLNLPDGVSFDFNRTDIKPQFYPSLNTVANTLREYNQTVVEVSGHTDDVGSDAVNQRISEQRANAVASCGRMPMSPPCSGMQRPSTGACNCKTGAAPWRASSSTPQAPGPMWWASWRALAALA